MRWTTTAFVYPGYLFSCYNLDIRSVIYSFLSTIIVSLKGINANWSAISSTILKDWETIIDR